MIISAKAAGFQNATAASANMTFRQPREALKPDGFTLEGAEQWALEQTSRLSADRFRLTSFWYIDYIRQHVPGERKTRYTARLAQSENYGIAFGLTVAFQDTEHTLALQDADRSLVGDDSREILKDRRYRTDIDRAALIDLVIGHSPATASDQVTLDQTLRDKHAFRARLFADETEIIMRAEGLRCDQGARTSRPRHRGHCWRDRRARRSRFQGRRHRHVRGYNRRESRRGNGSRRNKMQASLRRLISLLSQG